MAGILDTLVPGANAPGGNPIAKTAAAGVDSSGLAGGTVNPSAAAPPAGDITTQFPQLEPLVSGKIPATYTPLGYTSPVAEELNTRIPDLKALGVQFYQTKTDPAAAFVTYNPKAITLAQIEKADKAKAIAKTFPSIASLLGADPSEPQQAPPEGATEPNAAPIPIRPIPGNAQTGINTARLKSLNAPEVDPSKRAVPGAGVLFNSLLRKAQ